MDLLQAIRYAADLLPYRGPDGAAEIPADMPPRHSPLKQSPSNHARGNLAALRAARAMLVRTLAMLG